MNSVSSNLNPVAAVASDGFERAYIATAGERAALKASELLTINVDVPMAIAVARGTFRRTASLRAEIATALPTCDLAKIDEIVLCADALQHAQFRYIGATKPAAELPALLERASKLRELLIADANTLALRGILDSRALGVLKGGTGYLVVAYDLGALVAILRDRWEAVSKRIDAADLAEASELAKALSTAVEERDTKTVVEATEERTRAFTLFVSKYDELRRAATFLRWYEDDLDKIVPSLWAGRSSGRSDKQPATPPAPAPAPEPTTEAPHAAHSDPNLPGGSPFIS